MACWRRASLVSRGAAMIVLFVFSLAGHGARSESLFDETVRAKMLAHSDGLVAHIETRYNNIFVIKRRAFLLLTTRFAREDHVQSVVDLKDPDDMLAPYTRIVSVALVYPETIQRILMIGLGAGSISTYIGRAMPDVHIDAVELDPGVIAVGKKYFGLKETPRIRLIESDGSNLPRPSNRALRHHFVGCVSRTRRSIRSEYARILQARRRTPGASRRCGLQYCRRPEILSLDLGIFARGVSDCRYLSRSVRRTGRAGNCCSGAHRQAEPGRIVAARPYFAGPVSFPISSAGSA